MTFEELNNRIQDSSEDTLSLQKDIKNFVNDKNIPMEYRWTMFCNAGKNNIINKRNSYFLPLGINWDKYNLTNDFDVDRNQEYDVLSMLVKCIENRYEIDIHKFKENCMSLMIYKFVNSL
jgi:hypothetical protein